MKRLLSALITALLALSAYADTTVSIVRGDGDYFPKEYVEDAELKGLHIELIQAVAKDLDVHVIFKSLPWKRAIQELKKGNFDAITYMSRSDERDLFAWFLKGNIISSSQVFPVILAERKAEIEFDGSLESLRPYLIAVGDGYKYGEPFDSATRLLKYVLPPPDQRTLTGLLRKHRVDVVISSRRNLLKILTPEELDNEFHVFPQPVATDNSYLAFSKIKTDSYELASRFSKAISQYKTTRAFMEMTKRYEELEQARDFQVFNKPLIMNKKQTKEVE